MKQHTSLRGIVATQPTRLVSDRGNTFGEFRLAVTERLRNKETGTWEDGETHWFTVKVFNKLAENVYRSISVGDPVTVSGKISIRNWSTEEKSGTAVEVYADVIGHDLNAGFSEFQWVRAGEMTPSRPDASSTIGWSTAAADSSEAMGDLKSA